MAESAADLTKTYDAVVVGSGAAGGMAAHVLTTHGMKVLLLEAGKKLPIENELRSMEWPYDNPYRGELPPDRHSLSFNEYTIRRPPYGPGFEKAKHLHSYIGDSDYVKKHRRRRARESVHRHQLRMGPRSLSGRQDQYLGTLVSAPLGLRLQSQRSRWVRRKLAHQL